MINICITEYGTLKSNDQNFKEKTVEDFLKEIEKLLFEDESKIVSYNFVEKENECEFSINSNKYKIQLNSKDCKNFKILFNYNKLINQLKKYVSLWYKKGNFELLIFFGSFVLMGMMLVLFTSIEMSIFFSILLSLSFMVTMFGISTHILNNFIKNSILKINKEFKEQKLDLIKGETLENILEKDKKNTVEDQKLLSDSIVLNEVAKLSIKIDSLNNQDKIIFAKKLKQLLNEYRNKIDSMSSSSKTINLQIKDIVYIEREFLGLLSVMDLECEKIIIDDTKKKQQDKIICILDDNLGEMIEESFDEIHSEGGVQYVKK